MKKPPAKLKRNAEKPIAKRKLRAAVKKISESPAGKRPVKKASGEKPARPAASEKLKYYVLEMFSYPSASNLHMGHWFNYGAADIFARFKKMRGYDVFQPMGFDAFGLPAENYAVKTGVHPADSTRENIAKMEEQLRNMNAMFDWDAEIKTCEPDYYKWTQWLFLQLFKANLAYRSESPVNFCEGCKTVIANEQVVNGLCERCDTPVVRKSMKQWFFRITDYAEELLDGLAALDWPEKTKLMQKNWIGKSEGSEIEFKIIGSDGKPGGAGESFRVFTTRADTLFGVTYAVLAPEHSLAPKITAPERKKAVEDYVAETARKNETERLSAASEKTGVFTGAYALNPANGEAVPVYLGDYVLSTYGSGAVMAVPAHDARDFAFARKYGLPIKTVIRPSSGEPSSGEPVSGEPAADIGAVFEEDGVTVNSGAFSALPSADARRKITEFLRGRGAANFKTNYRLRDWSVSRQRYWGCPIPVVHCPEHGAVPVPERDLPVLLPAVTNFEPGGGSPLAHCREYMETTCPICGAAARRDPDTLDTFVCSSWYYLRYPFSKLKDAPWDKERVNALLPVDKYIGGAEHACMHLLYARFVTKAMRDAGYLKFDEPFTSLVHQGVILGADGNRMSKSRGNSETPDGYIAEYGADALRLYLAFGFSFTEGGPWSGDGIKAAAKFIERVERLIERVFAGVKPKKPAAGAAKRVGADKNEDLDPAASEVLRAYHTAAKRMAADIEIFSFNTAAARFMELVNALYKYDADDGKDADLLREICRGAVKLSAPFFPAAAQKLWKTAGGAGDVFNETYPVPDERYLTLAEVEYAVQINSKIRARLTLPSGLKPAEAEKILLSKSEVTPLLGGRAPKKIIIVPDKLANIIL